MAGDALQRLHEEYGADRPRHRVGNFRRQIPQETACFQRLQMGAVELAVEMAHRMPYQILNRGTPRYGRREYAAAGRQPKRPVM